MVKGWIQTLGLLVLFSSNLWSAEKARNAILFIGDGMGLNTLSVARVYSVGAQGRLQIEQLPHTALLRTSCEDRAVTDSAAAASAFATGFKTPFRRLNMTKDGKRRVLISELAKQKGLSVGIVTTTRLTDATPAAFYGYVEERQEEESLASQLLDADVDVALGGGREMFQPLLGQAKKRGWTVIQTANELKEAAQSSAKARVLGIFAKKDFHYQDERPSAPGEPTLAEMTQAAIERLARNPQGYFLMVEGGMIDKACHQNWAQRAMRETVEFDQAVGRALRCAGKDTLILVTADHETGGLSLNGYPPISQKGDDLLARQPDQLFLMAWTSGPGGVPSQNAVSFLDPAFQQPATYYTTRALHTSTDVPIAAIGPGADAVHGFLDNTDVFRIIRDALGL